jgi:glutamyl-tRNA reductase
MGKLTAVHLKAQQVRRMTIASRTLAHAEAVADRLGAQAIPWADFPAALVSSDIIITSTGSSVPVLTRAQMADAMPARRNRPLFIIDIAVPRDVEPAAGNLDQVFLYNIDDLQAIVKDNLARRGAEVARAEEIVEEEVRQFIAWMRSREAIPTVVALRQRFEAIRRAELQRLESKIAGLSPDARARIDEITHLIVEKLLLTPTEQLKSLSDHDTVVAYSDALSRLFSLTPDEAAASGDRTASARDEKTTVGS